MTDAPAVYLTDDQIARRLGLQQKEWVATARLLEPQGLPAADPLFGAKRYWPAVVAFLDRRNGLAARSPELSPETLERW